MSTPLLLHHDYIWRVPYGLEIRQAGETRLASRGCWTRGGIGTQRIQESPQSSQSSDRKCWTNSVVGQKNDPEKPRSVDLA